MLRAVNLRRPLFLSKAREEFVFRMLGLRRTRRRVRKRVSRAEKLELFDCVPGFRLKNKPIPREAKSLIKCLKASSFRLGKWYRRAELTFSSRIRLFRRSLLTPSLFAKTTLSKKRRRITKDLIDLPELKMRRRGLLNLLGVKRNRRFCKKVSESQRYFIIADFIRC